MAAWMKFLVVLLFCFHSVFSALRDEKPVVASVVYNNNTGKLEIHNDIGNNWVAKGEFSNSVNTTGWSVLTVTTNGDYADVTQAYAAGMVEGYLTRDFITMHWTNTVKGYCDEPLTQYCWRLRNYFQQNLDWMNHQIYTYTDEDAYWHQVNLFLVQVSGLTDGYYNVPGKPSTNVDPFGLYFFQVADDVIDLENALHRGTSSRMFGSGSCSALIKLLPGNRELYVAHDTWSTYTSMLRILKKYDFSFHRIQSSFSQKMIPGRVTTFSSYPGTILSTDDYYLMSSGLVTMETTLANDNPKLYVHIKPTDSVPEGIRTILANRLAEDGKSWSDYFSTFNSGTYNNQWMVVDYKMFKPGAPIMEGLLTILEQMPGYIVSQNLTSILQQQTYWPSYNIAYFPFIFNVSGQPQNVKKYGDLFSYDKTPRAKIFQRDHVKIKDIESMMKVMRYNDYQHDPLSRCKCNPPYSGENSISARCDLNPSNGTYPLGLLGHRLHGGIDMKLTNSTMFKDLGFIAVSGPTFDQLPPFQWSKADLKGKYSHLGQPDIFTFKPVYFNGMIPSQTSKTDS